MNGAISETSELLTKTTGVVIIFGPLVVSGPAIQIGETAFGPSQIPSSSVSGSRGSVPVLFSST